jgi:NAD(P)H dehydrogenase (quinone)
MNAPPPVRQLVVLAHPDQNSFCATVADTWRERVLKNHQICDVRDLYRDRFDPVLKANEQPGKPGYAPTPELQEELQTLQQIDVLVFVYPIWFGTPPAMMKGYIERVLGGGGAVSDGLGARRPLSHVSLVQISTSASSEAWLAEKGLESALHTILDRYVPDVFGARSADHLHLDSVVQTMTTHDIEVLLAEVSDLADRVCAEANARRWQRQVR